MKQQFTMSYETCLFCKACHVTRLHILTFEEKSDFHPLFQTSPSNFSPPCQMLASKTRQREFDGSAVLIKSVFHQVFQPATDNVCIKQSRVVECYICVTKTAGRHVIR